MSFGNKGINMSADMSVRVTTAAERTNGLFGKGRNMWGFDVWLTGFKESEHIAATLSSVEHEIDPWITALSFGNAFALFDEMLRGYYLGKYVLDGEEHAAVNIAEMFKALPKDHSAWGIINQQVTVWMIASIPRPIKNNDALRRQIKLVNQVFTLIDLLDLVVAKKYLQDNYEDIEQWTKMMELGVLPNLHSRFIFLAGRR